MDEIKIKHIIDKDDPLLKEFAHLVEKMYKEMMGHGLMLPLDQDGPEKWQKSVINTLNRFGCLIGALHNDTLVGFAHGSMGITPDYLGSKKIGAINHVYVEPDFRRLKIANKLVHELEKWFEGKNIHSIELQVLNANKKAIRFWDELGFDTELLQLRKLLDT